MAKIKMGALAQDARGSLNGTVFSKNRYAAYTRNKVSPVQPRTARQLDQRSFFTQVSQAWRNLTSAQRAAWDAWAQNHPIVNVFGDAVVMAGNAAFMKVNADILSLDNAQTLTTLDPFTGAILSTPPDDPVAPPAAGISVAADESAGTVIVTTATQGDGLGAYALWTTPGKSPGVQFVNADYRLAGAGLETDTITVAGCVPVTFNPKLGFVAGQKVSALLVRYSADGVVIDSTRFDTIAVA